MSEHKSIYIVYKTTNLINGKYYDGVHECYSLEFDGYLGSGTILNKSIKKYGRKNFMREILFVFDNYEEAYAKEKEIVNESFVNNKNTYNLKVGGIGGGPISHTKKSKDKMRIAKKGTFHTEETKSKISSSMKGIPKSNEHKMNMSNARTGIPLSKSHKAKMSMAQKGIKKPLITCPHCGKEGGVNVMKRWHFDNCRSL